MRNDETYHHYAIHLINYICAANLSHLRRRHPEAMKWCVVIPTYNNSKTLDHVIRDVLHYTSDIIVVNDGSTDQTTTILNQYPDVKVISYPVNKGKGFALLQGFKQAFADGYRYAITMDSDGQHLASDIPAFIAKINELPDALIVGSRKLPEEKLRKGSGFANKFSNFWFSFISGISLPDTQSGFRLYPLDSVNKMNFFSGKYEFELEVLIRCAWRKIPVTHIPINVYYPEKSERISHFRPFRDFVRISILNTICVLAALFYIKPLQFIRFFKKDHLKQIINKHLLRTNDSTKKITLSVMLGVFMGIIPIWGYQLVSAIGLAYFFRLNVIIVILAANISIFPLTAVIVYLSYITGGLFMSNNHSISFTSDITPAWFKENILQYIVGSIAFAIIAALFFGLLTYVLLTLYRKKPAHAE